MIPKKIQVTDKQYNKLLLHNPIQVHKKTVNFKWKIKIKLER